MLFNLDLWANGLIALAFVVVAGCIGWLWWHRRRDWPETWILAALFFCLLFCGAARLSHATYIWHRSPMLIVILDWFAGVIGMMGAVMLPGGVRAVRRLPTPQEYDRAIRQLSELEFVKERLRWKEEREKQLAELLKRRQRQVGTLQAILNGTSLPDETKQRITEVIEDTK